MTWQADPRFDLWAAPHPMMSRVDRIVAPDSLCSLLGDNNSAGRAVGCLFTGEDGDSCGSAGTAAQQLVMANSRTSRIPSFPSGADWTLAECKRKTRCKFNSVALLGDPRPPTNHGL